MHGKIDSDLDQTAWRLFVSDADAVNPAADIGGNMASAALLMIAVTIAQPHVPAGKDFHILYPAAAFRANRGGIADYALRVSAEGRPVSCAISQSSGSEDLDHATCETMMKMEFQPARDGMGHALPRIFRGQMAWRTKGMRAIPPRPQTDVTISVVRLPKGIEDRSRVRVAAVVDAGGAVSECTPIQPIASSDDGKSDLAKFQHDVALLGPTACAQTLVAWKPAPFLDEAGTAVPSIQTANVLFEIKSTPR